MSLKQSSQRKRLGRWSGCFFFWNTLIILMIGISYISFIPSYSELSLLDFFGKFFGISFVILAFVGQSALLAFISGGLAYLLIQCVPKTWFAFSISITLASLLVLALVVDAILYHLYHYHLMNLVWSIFFSGTFSQVIMLSPLEWLIFAWIIVGIVCLELLIAYWIWRYQQNTIPKRYGRMIFLTFSMCLFVSYAIYFSAHFIITHPKQASLEQQVNDRLVITEAKIVPYYINFLRIAISDDTRNQSLQYPVHPIKAKTIKHSYNIVVIAIDSWRSDMMHSIVTPHIAAFAQRSINFTNHYSGGNATQPGIFSLFYSIPSTYWSATLTQQQGPVFIKQLLKDHYQMGVFSSAELNFPSFDKTVFRDVPDLRVYTPGSSAAERDANMTKAFNVFIKHRDPNRPFFGFLFYDAVHGYCEAGSKYLKPFQPAISECDRMVLTNTTDPLPYINRYKNAVLYDDRLIGDVLQNLTAQHLLKNTIVIITADHGEEFNDEHLDYWGHSSAFDPYQLRTPLIVYWPGKKADTIYNRTSHYDIVPTLMTKALGVTTPTTDYSIGGSLFLWNSAPYVIAGGDVSYAIIEPNQTTIMYPGDNYDVTYPNGSPKPKATLNLMLMNNVYKVLNRYYR